MGAGLLAAVVAIAAAFALASGGGDDGGDGTTVAAQTEAAPPPEGEERPQALSRQELIERADAVCAESQRRYVEIRNTESEFTTDVLYAEALVRNARQRVGGLRALEPPPALAAPYGSYVAAQERVLETDKAALAAAREEDAAGVEAARNDRDAEDALREKLAGKIGFNVCSVPKS